jgi:hypothetical protein
MGSPSPAPGAREAAGHEETVIKAGKLVPARKVAPLPFMRRDGWQPYHVREAGVLCDLFPLPWHLCAALPHDVAATSKGKM